MGCGSSIPVTSQSERERLKRIELCHESFKKNDGRLIVRGVLQRANARNRNGRVYPKGILKRETDRYYEYVLKHGRALGELDHPNPHSPTFRCLNFNNVSHQVLEFHWEGDDLKGTVEVLPTPAGSMLKDLYLAGCRLGMSSRGWATLKEKDGCVFIQDDFELITFDFVSDPSTDGAYLEPVLGKLGLPAQINLMGLIKQLKATSGHVDLHSPYQPVDKKKLQPAPAVPEVPPMRPSTPGPVTSRDKACEPPAGADAGVGSGEVASDEVKSFSIAAQTRDPSPDIGQASAGSISSIDTDVIPVPNLKHKNQIADESQLHVGNGGRGSGGAGSNGIPNGMRAGPGPGSMVKETMPNEPVATAASRGGEGMHSTGARPRTEAMTLRDIWHQQVQPEKEKELKKAHAKHSSEQRRQQRERRQRTQGGRIAQGGRAGQGGRVVQGERRDSRGREKSSRGGLLGRLLSL